MLAGLADPAPKAVTEEPWMPLVRLQVKDANGCDVAHLVFSREVPLGNAVSIEGRLRCVDGREYDFTRARPHLKFDFRLCQPTIC